MLWSCSACVDGAQSSADAMGPRDVVTASDSAAGDVADARDSVALDVPRVPPAQLNSVQHLLRVSMAIRGFKPSLAELLSVQANPAMVATLTDQYLQSSDFGETIRDLHNESLKVKVPSFFAPAGFPSVGALTGQTLQHSNDAITDAPLRLIQYVIENNRPYSEIVTADYTVANSIVADVWGIAPRPASEAWQRGRYIDGRPHAGILSDSELFTVHGTTLANANRGRANFVSTALLCYDFLSREISVDTSINLADPRAVSDAVVSNEACASCHQTLDPLASYFGLHHPTWEPPELYYSGMTAYPYQFYLPNLGNLFAAREPGYFGRAASGLRNLGLLIAQDPRFALCAVRRFYAYLHNTTPENVSVDRAIELQRSFVDSNLNARALVRNIVLSEDFRVSHALDPSPASDVVGLYKMRPHQLARTVYNLTGFRWETDFPERISYAAFGYNGRVDLMYDSVYGFDVLFGGIDSFFVNSPSHTMNVTSALVLRAMASQAAPYAIAHDFAIGDPTQRRLFTHIGDGDPSEPHVRGQMSVLHARFYGEMLPMDAAEISATYQLFARTLTASGGNVRRAWTMVVYSMLQDPRFLFY